MKLDRRINHAAELTVEQVHAICEACQKNGLPKSGLGVSMRPPFSDRLSGQQLRLVFDDFTEMTYRFVGSEELEWRMADNPFTTEYCQILELAEGSNLFYIQHLQAYSFPLQSFSLVIDMDQDLVTLIHASLGAYERPREVDREFHFGYISRTDKKPPQARHGFTREMDGLIIDWHYDELGTFAARHFYVDHLHKIDRLFRNGQAFFYAAESCDYIRIRPGVFLMSWLEIYGQGVQGSALIDMASLRDVGSFFGINYEGTLDSHTFAAQGERVDQF